MTTANMPTVAPSSTEAEQAVLGAMLFDNTVIQIARDILKPEDFYRTVHQGIFRTMLAMADSGVAVDNLTLTNALNSQGKLVSIGGAAYLGELLTTVPGATNIVAHARIVAEKARLRTISNQLMVAMEAVKRGAEQDHLAALIHQIKDTTTVSVTSPTNKIEAIPFSEIKQEQVQWTWDGRIPTRMITGVVGDPDLGKTGIICDVAAKASRGQLAGDYFGQPVAVCVCSAEDSPAHTLGPRLTAAGADMKLVRLMQFRHGDITRGVLFPDDCEEIRATMQEIGAKMLIVDPLVAHLPSGLNSWRDQDVRIALGALNRLAEEVKAAVIFVVHLNKNSSAPNPLYRISNSIGIPAAARSILWAAQNPTDEANKVLLHLKCNVAAKAPALRYRIESRLIADGIKTSGIVWTGEDRTIQAEDLMEQPRDNHQYRGALAEAKDWLWGIVGTQGMEAASILKETEKAGFSERTIRRAKADLGIKAQFDGKKWVWVQPDKQDSRGGQSKTSGSLAPGYKKTINNNNIIEQGCQAAKETKTNSDGNMAGSLGGAPRSPSQNENVSQKLYGEESPTGSTDGDAIAVSKQVLDL